MPQRPADVRRRLRRPVKRKLSGTLEKIKKFAIGLPLVSFT
jgi:hypothetical protein